MAVQVDDDPNGDVDAIIPDAFIDMQVGGLIADSVSGDIIDDANIASMADAGSSDKLLSSAKIMALLKAENAFLRNNFCYQTEMLVLPQPMANGTALMQFVLSNAFGTGAVDLTSRGRVRCFVDNLLLFEAIHDGTSYSISWIQGAASANVPHFPGSKIRVEFSDEHQA